MGDKHLEVFACYSLAFAVGFIMLTVDFINALSSYLIKFVPLGSERRNIFLQDVGGGGNAAGDVGVADNPFAEPVPAEITIGSVAPWLCVF